MSSSTTAAVGKSNSRWVPASGPSVPQAPDQRPPSNPPVSSPAIVVPSDSDSPEPPVPQVPNSRPAGNPPVGPLNVAGPSNPPAPATPQASHKRPAGNPPAGFNRRGKKTAAEKKREARDERRRNALDSNGPAPETDTASSSLYMGVRDALPPQEVIDSQ
ncbi:hypothetical protein GGTG_01146 [Gaeumannomyces tritici R3-111a-1]|uniref:Uncharacterized protein n=1 Tax=Gaeumannomyces tritici (strain R3-111a-1) TaxID=644352 RepID=J3NIR2_GAET3|nr:hypothetical protein GGTG_01146 [Gaeumannomyces tritici R3-111a-1]EJT81162.1 hypothetical protein GGTG_01146 [Gaeumannomyces tritici R3-111a-1]